MSTLRAYAICFILATQVGKPYSGLRGWAAKELQKHVDEKPFLELLIRVGRFAQRDGYEPNPFVRYIARKIRVRIARS